MTYCSSTMVFKQAKYYKLHKNQYSVRIQLTMSTRVRAGRQFTGRTQYKVSLERVLYVAINVIKLHTRCQSLRCSIPGNIK